MRSILVHLRDTTDDQVAEFLTQEYPTQPGPSWICEVAGDPCLYIDFYRDASCEIRSDAWSKLTAALGKEPDVSVIADISGRHPGDEQVTTFVLTLLDRFHGVAQDDYTDYSWTADDIRAGRKFQGHGFFDYQGWHEGQKSD